VLAHCIVKYQFITTLLQAFIAKKTPHKESPNRTSKGLFGKQKVKRE